MYVHWVFSPLFTKKKPLWFIALLELTGLKSKICSFNQIIDRSKPSATYIHRVMYTGLFSIRVIFALLNLPRHWCVFREIISDIGIRPVLIEHNTIVDFFCNARYMYLHTRMNHKKSILLFNWILNIFIC